MKILALHTSEAGSLGSQVFHFKDDWSGTIATNILFSGTQNGCGKSSALRASAVACLRRVAASLQDFAKRQRSHRPLRRPQYHAEGGTLMQARANLNVAFVCENDMLHNRETKSCATILARTCFINAVKTLKNAIKVVLGYANAVVFNF